MAPFYQIVSNAASRSVITAIPYFPDDIASSICFMSGGNA